MSFGQSKDTVCKYYLQGQCRFGANCRFAHPAGQGPTTNPGASTFRNQAWTANKDAKSTGFDAESILKDLTQGQERPLYPLSSYGPGKSVPCVIDGLDQSPEELRVAAWTAMRESAGLDAYKAHEKQLIDASQTLINAALTTGPITLDEAKRVWNSVDDHGIPPVNGEAEAKSRLRDRLQSSSSKTAFGSTPSTSAFGNTSAFGASQSSQPSAFGSTGYVKPGAGAFGSNTGAGTFGGGTNSTFGNSAFGSSSQPSAFGTSAPAPAFGQSGFGAKPAFGQASFGATSASTPTASAFGSSNPAATTSAFGQSGFGSSTNAAAAFGQSGFGTKPATSAFGAGATGGGFGAFSGKSTSFGSNNSSNTTSAFSAPATGVSAFGSEASGAPTFGTSGGTGSGFGAFANKSTSFGGQPSSSSTFGSAPATSGGAFGQPAPIVTATTADSGMEADTPTTSAPPSVFGQTQPTPTSAFGQNQPVASAFGVAQTSTPPAFGQGAVSGGGSAFGASKPSAFGTSTPATTSAFGTSTSTTSAFGAPGKPSAFGASTTTSAFGTAVRPSAFGGNSAFGSSNTASAFGKSTTTPSNPFGPKSAKDRDPYAVLLPPDYATTLSEGIMNAFKADKFELGSIPECVPPFEVR